MAVWTGWVSAVSILIIFISTRCISCFSILTAEIQSVLKSLSIHIRSILFFLYLSIYLCIYLSIYVSIYLSLLSFPLSIFQSIHSILSISLSFYICCILSSLYLGIYAFHPFLTLSRYLFVPSFPFSIFLTIICFKI